MTEDKFIRVKSGSIYRWTEMLMKRRDAVEVDGHTAAKYFRDQGIEIPYSKHDVYVKSWPEQDDQ